MAGSLVVVAVPDENDRVWKVSSEKAPHMTLLFLGEDANEVPNVDQIVLFVRHAADTMLRQFSLSVERRGELGEDKADVLFFKKTRYDFKAINDFRASLLQDSNIKTAYDSTPQFEGGWKPHLTLGYPETPAKREADDSISTFYDVSFNKIAVWMGDFKGPEFLLKDYWEDFDMGDIPMDVAMSEIAHYGVKGMRWGVRNDRSTETKKAWLDPEGRSLKVDVAKAALLPVFGAAAQVRLARGAVRGTKAYMEHRKTPEEVAKREKRRLARKDFFWEAHAYSDIAHADVHNKVADEIDTKVYRLQTAPKYRGKNLKTDKALSTEYEQDVAKVTDAAYRRAVKDTFGTNPSGTKEARYVNDVRGARIEIRDRQTGKTLNETDLNPVQEDIRDEVGHSENEHTSLSHAVEVDEPQLFITVRTNDEGFITEIGRVKLPEDDETAMEQTVDLGAKFLEHYGVKGMRWGVRNESRRDISLGRNRPTPEAVAPKATSVVPQGARRKTKIKTEGGENQPAHEDAVKVARAHAKLKKSGTAALSNQELQELQTRLNLERNVTTLVKETGRVGKGRKFVRDLTGINREFNEAVNTPFQTTRIAKQVRPA